MMYMVGTLWKWTNYFSGWQERWFILDNGILSYYKSQDDVNTGCKGSVKMSVCDISVHPTDNTRLDLIIPGEQHFYVKAPSAKERQQWLVALGTAKASMGKINEETENVNQDLFKKKRSELRLYCDLLMQQVHSVKMSLQDDDEGSLKGEVTEKLDKATSLISPTCDMFIQALEDCMDMVNSSSSVMFETQNSPITGSTLPPSPLKIPSSKKTKHVNRQNSLDRVTSHNHSRSPSTSSADIPSLSRHRTTSDASLSDRESNMADQRLKSTSNASNSQFHNSHKLKGNVQSNSISENVQNNSLTGTNCDNGNGKVNSEQNVNKSNNSSGKLGTQSGDEQSDDVFSEGEVFQDPIEPKVPTFFSDGHSLFDVKTDVDGGIPVEPFLESCKNLLPIFDKLNSTAFAPVKMDFQGNIRKVRTKCQGHPESFTTLQSIILHEISKKQQYLPSSATMALLWLKRSLEFIAGFVREIKNGEDNLTTAATNAYAISLKPYHGWVVRGVFAVAVKALPYKSTFINLLNPQPGHVDQQVFLSSLMVDIDAFCSATKTIVDILNNFFSSVNLNTNEQI